MTPFSNIAPKREIWVSNTGSNGNSGSASSPMKSIQAALDKATPGTAVMVKAGTYVENVVFKHSGQANAPIQLISADGTGEAKIKPAKAGGATISGFGEENIVIRGFDVTAQSKTNGIQFGMAGTDFKDLTKSIVIQNNIVRSAGQDAIKISQGDNIHILGNKIIGAGEQGVDFVAVNNSVISHNDISKITGVAALFAKGGSTNVTIGYNKIHDVDVDGITIGGWTTPSWMRPGMRDYEAKNVVAIGNAVYDVGKRPLSFLGARDSTATENLLSGNPDYYTVVNVSAAKTKPSFNITITNNTVDRGTKWLTVETGQGKGLVVSGNHFDGVWNGKAGAVGGESGSAAQAKTFMVTTAKHMMGASEDNATITASGGSKVTGNTKANTIKGGAGNDTIDGASGNDTLTGNGGKDVFVVAKARGNDTITDFHGAAGDTVRLEGFQFNGFAAVKGAMKQVGTDVMLDLGGGQALKFIDAKVSGFSADDFHFSSTVSNAPTPTPVMPAWSDGGVTVTAIRGGSKADNLKGTDKNDMIEGGAGQDTMTGGKGNDTYVVGTALDKVVEKAGEGTDTIKAWVDYSYTLPANVENLIGMNNGGMALTGNSLMNIIKGGAGNDIITGGAGADQLWGGAGRDSFVFKSLSDKGDVVMDFKTGEDFVNLRTLMSADGEQDVEVVAKGPNAVAVWVHHDDKVDELVTLMGVNSSDIGAMQPGKAAWLLL